MEVGYRAQNTVCVVNVLLVYLCVVVVMVMVEE